MKKKKVGAKSQFFAEEKERAKEKAFALLSLSSLGMALSSPLTLD